jgi:NAD(P)H-dependent flavin oxidoreductase YrpB (nitropropane dioxygenase family)
MAVVLLLHFRERFEAYTPLLLLTFFILQRRYGASGVWVGTRFVASVEAGAPPKHKELVLSAGYDDTVRTLIYSGRPLHVRKTPYVADWESHRQGEIMELIARGRLPHDVELEKHPEKSLEGRMCK